MLVCNAAELTGLTFRLLRDDGAAVYLNGAEVYRENIAPGVLTNLTKTGTNVAGVTNNGFPSVS